jgi:hypothetical protein
MRRALHVAFLAIAVGFAGSTAAQLPGGDMPPGSTPTTPPSAVPTPTAPTPSTDTVQPVPPGQSAWRSDKGSLLELTVDPAAGTLVGTFTPGFPCGSTSPGPQPIVGTVKGNALAWALSLPGCPSVGTWIGHFRTVETQEQLNVLWTLALPEFPPGVGSMLTGSAVFVRQTGP